MCANEHERSLQTGNGLCRNDSVRALGGMSRRGFLGSLGGAAALGSLTLAAAPQARGASAKPAARTTLPPGAALRVKAALAYQLPRRRAKTSWRDYGGLQTQRDVNEEAKRIQAELKKLAADAEFPIEVLPLALITNDRQAKEVAAGDCDTILVYAASGGGRGGLALVCCACCIQGPNGDVPAPQIRSVLSLARNRPLAPPAEERRHYGGAEHGRGRRRGRRLR